MTPSSELFNRSVTRQVQRQKINQKVSNLEYQSSSQQTTEKPEHFLDC